MILGITGRARSGKDSFAEMLAEELFNITQRKFVLMAYAHELKLRVQKDFDLSYEQLWGSEKEEEDKRYPKEDGFWSAREILQFFGTECMRAIDNDFWVKHLFRVIEEKGYKDVIVTDVRFPNEADPIVKHEGYIIKLERKSKDEIHGSTHASEVSMDNYEHIDFVVGNDGSMEDLRKVAQDTAKVLIETDNIKNKLLTKPSFLEG